MEQSENSWHSQFIKKYCHLVYTVFIKFEMLGTNKPSPQGEGGPLAVDEVEKK